MLSGLSGHLISEAHLARVVDQRLPGADDPEPKRRAFLTWRRRCAGLGPASGLRTVFEVAAEPLVLALGYDRPAEVERQNDLITATLRPAPMALVVAGWGARLDPVWRPAVLEARRRRADWCLVFNGTHLRLISATRVYSRRYLDFDLELSLEDPRAFNALLLVLCASGQAPLEKLIEGSDGHSAAVCRSLREGVLEASTRILQALMRFRPRPPVDEAFEQALTIVYRILFLLFAEARHLVPLWHPIYRDSYSLETLRTAAERRRAPPGLWDALRAVNRLAHAGCRAGDLRVTAFNGRLFAPMRTPLAERRSLDDAAAGDALVSLATRPAGDGTAREAIAYRDLGVEQLGAVYETLLDYAPRLGSGGRPVSLQPGAGIRKETGTFYTPLPLARYLVRRTLAPLVREATPARIMSLKILDPAMGSGAFLVAACNFLAEAYESAIVQSGECGTADIGPRERALIRRTVAERCLFGVDLNPMAVQLARLSLWLATLAADRPLSFLDHHLQIGDSLVGAWLTSLRQSPPSTRPRPAAAPLFDECEIRAALIAALPVRFALAFEPNDTAEQVRKKDRALASINRPDTPLSRWKRVADLWCAHWFSQTGERSPQAFGALSDAILTGRGPLPDSTTARLLDASRRIAERRLFFHWELEFPEAFFDKEGVRLANPGFDAVIGNPPWDMIRADAGRPDVRRLSRDQVSALLRFTRDSGTYKAQSDGHANRYQLFVERAVMLTRHAGRVGLVLPAGIAADHGSARLRRLLFSQCDVDAVIGFDNRDGVFPIHRSVRFVLLTATSGVPTTRIRCRLGERRPSVLDMEEEEDDGWFPIRLSPSFLEKVSGDGLAIPDLRAPVDLEILERAVSLFPPLGDPGGWGAKFGRELNITDDRHVLRSAGAGLPVVEGKHLMPFCARTADARWAIPSVDADRLIGTRHRRARLGYRDVASATNRQTLIAAVLPAGCVSTHTIFCLRTAVARRDQYLLCGLFNSLVVNYLARLRVTTHVTTEIVERLPIPVRVAAPETAREIARLAIQLAKRREGTAAMTAKLNALVAELYRLTESEFTHVLGTFPLVPALDRDHALSEFRKRR